MSTNFILMLLGFGIVSFVQNMAFTWSSRSRNSGDPDYHRKASWCSNGIYYITNALLTIYIIHTQLWWMLAIQGLVYTLTTAEGSVLMMKRLIKTEKGKQKVGNQFTTEEATLIRQRMLLVDTGDGVGTFTTAELAQLKELCGTKLETVDELVIESSPGSKPDFTGKVVYTTPTGDVSTLTPLPEVTPQKGFQVKVG
jgi:hypothetical protein